MMNSEAPQNKRRPYQWVVSVGLICTAIVLGWLAGNRIYTEYVCQQWPTANGTILSSGVDSADFGSGGGSRTDYYLELSYKYKVDGHIYHGWRFNAWGKKTNSDSSEIYDLARQYPKGRQVSVHYDPTNPSSSLLVLPGRHALIVDATGWSAVICFMILMAIGILFAKPKGS